MTSRLWAVGPRADTGSWATISDLTFTNNILRNACGGLFAFALDGTLTTVPATRLLVKNSLLYGLTGNFAEVDGGFSDVTFDVSARWQDGDPGQEIVLVAVFAKTSFLIRFFMEIAPQRKRFDGTAFATSYSPSGPLDDTGALDVSLRGSAVTMVTQ